MKFIKVFLIFNFFALVLFPAKAQNPPRVLNGIDVLEKESFERLKGLRLGLITNHSGVNLKHQLTADLFFESPNVKLVKLFGPEHGIRGQLNVENISDEKDAKTGLPVISLYGDHKAPTQKHLQDIDALVFDIQDIGTRFFTYISTMKLSMEAASKYKKKFIVLDRINPIGGSAVEGPYAVDKEVFVGIHPISIRHGMTVGELAKMFKAEMKWDLDLEIVEVEGYNREMLFEDTQMKWLNPSPIMNSQTTALLYPGTGLAEFGIATGRGTDMPLEVVGAPYVDGKLMAKQINDNIKLSGVKVSAIEFIPSRGLYAGEKCGGLKFEITNAREFQPMKMGLAIAYMFYRYYPRNFSLKMLNVLLLNSEAIEDLKSTKRFHDIWSKWETQAALFKARRSPYLIY